MINPKKQKNEKNRKRRPLNTSRRRFVTFLSPEIQLTNTHLLSVIVGLTFLCHARAHTSSVMLGLGVDSWRERAISEVRGLRDERGPTQLGIYTRASLDSPTKTGNDRKRNVIVGLDPTIPKTQGTCSRYARRKQRASTKVRAAADVAVKLATACVIRGLQKVWRMRCIVKK